MAYRQARELLTAVTYAGYQLPGRYSRGHRLQALFASMYFAALRPSEAVALRRQDCHLPESGWGRLTLEKSRPEVLASRPYDLRHAAVSLWLNAGVSPQDVAQRAGHSVEVLLRVYAKCLHGCWM